MESDPHKFTDQATPQVATTEFGVSDPRLSSQTHVPSATTYNRVMPPKKQTKSKKLATLVSSVIFVAIAVMIFSFLTHKKLENINYSNGKGQNFNVMFYKGASIKTPEEIRSLANSKTLQVERANFLTAPPKDGVSLTLQLTELNGPSLTERQGLCNSKPLTISGQLNSGDVCALTAGDVPVMYFFEFRDGGRKFLAFVFLDYDRDQWLASPEKAIENLKKTDLRPYNNDLTKILGSIKAIK